MSEPNVLVNFRLDREHPIRVRWLATDGVPGDGYKPQISAIRLLDGSEIHMDNSAIVEQTAADPGGGIGGYLVTFNGMVGFAADHPDRPIADRINDDEIEYDLIFLKEDGSAALEDQDYKVLERPRAMAHKLSKRDA
ncbi:MAG: hypothetical protein ABI867_29665 [Kofleriaceae bacterium]